MESLAEALPKEQARVRELLTHIDVDPSTVIAVTLIKQTLSAAEVAAASGDVVAIIRAYKELQAVH